MGETFDRVVDNMYFGENSFEKPNGSLLRKLLNWWLKSRRYSLNIDFLLAGAFEPDDLSKLCGKYFRHTLFGLYGACSTMMEG